MRCLIPAVFFTLATTVAGAADDPKEAAKKLEGTYEVLEVIVDGKPDAGKKDEVTGVEIKDGVIIPRVKDKKEDDKAKFTLDPSKKPAHIDLTPNNGGTLSGIYEVKESDKGTELTIAFNGNPKGERPKDFKGQGKEEMVIKLFRKKAK
jgi:uncharacterized protein (TIGR03067 family)